MTVAATAAAELLAALRGFDAPIEWRRGRPHPDAAALSMQVELAVAAGALDGAAAAESRAIAAGLRLDPLAALDGLASLLRSGLRRRNWALARLSAMATAWTLILESAPPAVRDHRQVAAETVLRRLAGELSELPILWVRLAQVVTAGRGRGAAVDDLEAAVAAGAPVATRYYAALLEPFAALPEPPDIARALAVPTSDQAAALDHSAFRALRAVGLATAAWQLRQLAADGLFAPRHQAVLDALAAVPQAEFAVTERLEEALAASAAAAPTAAATTLASLAEDTLLRGSPLPAAEPARLAVVAALLRAHADLAGGDVAALLSLTRSVRVLLPQTTRFWAEPAYRRETCAAVLGPIGRLPDPPRSRFAGLFAFGLEDDDRAAAHFAAAAAVEPAGAGVGTVVGPAAVASALAVPAAPLLGEAGFRFAGEAPTHGGPIVCASGDERYVLRYAADYAARLRRAALADPVLHLHLHLHLIGEPAVAAPALAAAAATAADAGWTASSSSESPEIAQAYYYATARFVRLPALRGRFAGPLLCTDIDRGWPGPPSAILRRLGSADVGLRLMATVRQLRMPGRDWLTQLAPPLAPWHAVNANLLVLADTAGARVFAVLLARLADVALRQAAARPGRHWGIDQNILLAAYRHALWAHPKITFADLGWPDEEFLPPEAVTIPDPSARHWIGAG